MSVLLVFAALALVFGHTLQYNYMFFRESSGTPFSIFENWTKDNLCLYDVSVLLSMILFTCVYYSAFELALFIIRKMKRPKAVQQSLILSIENTPKGNLRPLRIEDGLIHTGCLFVIDRRDEKGCRGFDASGTANRFFSDFFRKR